MRQTGVGCARILCLILNTERARCIVPLRGETLIIGTRADLAEVERIWTAIERYGEPFLRREFLAGERCRHF